MNSGVGFAGILAIALAGQVAWIVLKALKTGLIEPIRYLSALFGKRRVIVRSQSPIRFWAEVGWASLLAAAMLGGGAWALVGAHMAPHSEQSSNVAIYLHPASSRP